MTASTEHSGAWKTYDESQRESIPLPSGTNRQSEWSNAHTSNFLDRSPMCVRHLPTCIMHVACSVQRAGSRKGSRPTTSRPKVYFPPRMNLEESLWHEEKSSDEPRCVADAASWVEYRQAKFGVIASKAAEDTNNARTFR
ncbi:unnamed protein product [Zymoseptoria tritici ST99CH_3D7]|uniref:Uncharacterized protein n=1 Tax=Zymoseptoria tritici (strain ST99CH_3D7) TaxID=1276538 RepID=A0A1X7S334_ZYMT9|nr:unnamed protein product [Zymoseptoria tritici ST99CH_3D7]